MRLVHGMFSDVDSLSSDEPTQNKKTSKPMMEKKRRARINHCLSQLKDVLVKDKHVSHGHAKWEKADILEMTVDYVMKLRTQLGIQDTIEIVNGCVVEKTEVDKELENKTFDKEDTEPNVALGNSIEKPAQQLLAPKPVHALPATPSPSSVEPVIEPPPQKRRRVSVPPPPPPSLAEAPAHLPAPAPQMPPIPFPQPTGIPGFPNFLAQHLMALQYSQNMKMATLPPMMNSIGMTSFTLGSIPPWRV